MGLSSRLDRLLAGRPPELIAAVAASRLVFRVAHLMEQRIDAALAPAGLAMREYLALVLIADAAVEPLRPSDLSATLGATRTQVTRLLDGLEGKGLARRLPHDADRRSLQLGLTPAGRDLLKRAAPAAQAAYRASWKDVGTADTKQAIALLRTVHDTLAPESAE
jgi:MarR family transcriptional repressor of emrRAB